MKPDIQTKRDYDKEEEIEDLLDSLRDTLLLEICFRITKDSEGEFKMVGLYDYVVLHGFGDIESIEMILEAANEYFIPHGHITEIGHYGAYVLVKKDSSSDGMGRSWSWWELDYMSVNHFTTLEQMVEYEIEYENRKEEPNSQADNDLPF